MSEDPDTVEVERHDQARGNPFVCNICKKSYSRIDHLARHYRSRELCRNWKTIDSDTDPGVKIPKNDLSRALSVVRHLQECKWNLEYSIGQQSDFRCLTVICSSVMLEPTKVLQLKLLTLHSNAGEHKPT